MKSEAEVLLQIKNSARFARSVATGFLLLIRLRSLRLLRRNVEIHFAADKKLRSLRSLRESFFVFQIFFPRWGCALLAAYTWIMLAAYATCDDYLHNAYPWRFLNFKIYCCLGVHAGIMVSEDSVAESLQSFG